MERLKIAMLSLTHGHSRKYFQTLLDNPNLSWMAAYAESEEIKKHFDNQKFGIPCYLDEKEMYDRHPEIEAVVMASANNKHIEQFRECARRGVHILCMKIPTFDMSEYQEMLDLVEQTNIVCQVELELHYNPVVTRLKKTIADGTIGNIISIQATNITLSPVWAFPWQGIPEESYGKRIPLFDGDSRFRGGALCDHPHIFDLIRWLTASEFDHLYAETAKNMRQDLQVEDLLLVNGITKNGVRFLLDPSWSRTEERLKVPGPGWEIYPKRMEVNVTVSGEKGVLMADCFGPNVYHNGVPNDRYTVQYTYFDEWIGLIDEFVDCIRNKKTPKINLAWHKKTIEAMNACYDSIACRQPVYL